MEKICGIYLLKNRSSGRVYVGSSTNIDFRIKQHFYSLKKNCHANKDLQTDYNKGCDFDVIIYKRLSVTERTFLLIEERKAIEHHLKQNIPVYNKAPINADFVSPNNFKTLIADLYCKEHYGRTYAQFTGRFVPASYSMYYDILQHPEQEEEIRDKYYSVIKLQMEQRFYREHGYEFSDQMIP